jgi:hypothetical protein
MVWLTWRQFRAQAVVATASLAAVATALLITGVLLRHSYANAGLPACHVHRNCEQLATSFINHLPSLYERFFSASTVVLYAVPGLIGLFWGAPLLAREFEMGTLRLAWNQSASRNRWLGVKLGLIGLVAMATAGLFSLLITWWASPIDRALGYAGPNAVIGLDRLDPALFGARGIAPIGYAAFALVLGVTAGVLIRRTVPAMAVTLAAFVGVQIIWPNWIRPHLISPAVAKSPLTNSFNELVTNVATHQMTVVGNWHQAGAWFLSDQTITPSGHVFAGPATSACLGSSFQACVNWIASKHLRQLVTYQPASRFWSLQGIETAIFVLIAVALAVFCAWRIRSRRLA